MDVKQEGLTTHEENKQQSDSIKIENLNEYQGLEVNNKGSLKQSGAHALNSTWSIWYISRKEQDRNIPYLERVRKIG